MHQPAIKFGRFVLLVAGLVLLVIFGMRAASQAPSMAAAGGKREHTTTPLGGLHVIAAQLASTGSEAAIAYTATALSAPPQATNNDSPPPPSERRHTNMESITVSQTHQESSTSTDTSQSMAVGPGDNPHGADSVK